MFFLAVKITGNDFKYGIFVARNKRKLISIACENFNSKKNGENNFFLRGNRGNILHIFRFAMF